MQKRQEEYKSHRWWMDGSTETVSSRHSRSNVPMNSWRLGQHTLVLHRFKPDKISALKRTSEHKAPPITKMLFVIDTHWQRGKNGFYNGVSLGIWDPGVVGQYRANTRLGCHLGKDLVFVLTCFVLFFLACFVFFFFLLFWERTWSWVSREVVRIWEKLWEKAWSKHIVYKFYHKVSLW